MMMNMKILKLFLPVVLVCLTFGSVTVGAWEGVTGVDWLDDTPKENVFRVEGDKREFILLDVTDNPQSRFFVLAKEYYADREFDSRGKSLFNPKDGKNLGGWLNGSFIKYGNQVNSGEIMKFPGEIINHIDMKHFWITDGKTAETEELGTYGVGLMSQEEMVKYADKFGVDDGLTTSSIFTNTYGWWIRTQDDTDTANKIVFRFDKTNNGSNIHGWSANVDGIAVRPCFYLNESFFSDVRINLWDMGENVRRAIKKIYLKESMAKIYDEEELWDKFGYSANINIKVESLTDKSGNKADIDAEYVSAEIKADSKLKEDTDASVLMVLYGEDNCPVRFEVKNVRIPGRQESTHEIEMPLQNVSKERGFYFKIYIIKPGTKLKAFSNAVRIYL